MFCGYIQVIATSVSVEEFTISIYIDAVKRPTGRSMGLAGSGSCNKIMQTPVFLQCRYKIYQLNARRLPL
jgi:hypothetical protein